MSRLVQLVVVACVAVAIPGCGDSRVNKANYEKVTLGMALTEVQEILGPGTRQAQGDGSAVGSQFGVDVTMGGQASVGRGEVYEWESGNRKITVYFGKDGKVASKQSRGI